MVDVAKNIEYLQQTWSSLNSTAPRCFYSDLEVDVCALLMNHALDCCILTREHFVGSRGNTFQLVSAEESKVLIMEHRKSNTAAYVYIAEYKQDSVIELCVF